MSASPWPWDAIKKRVADMMSSGYGGQTPPPATAPRMYAPVAKEPPPKSDEGRGALVGNPLPMNAVGRGLAKIRGTGGLSHDLTPYSAARAVMSGGMGAGVKDAAINVGMDSRPNPIGEAWDIANDTPASPRGLIRMGDKALE